MLEDKIILPKANFTLVSSEVETPVRCVFNRVKSLIPEKIQSVFW